MCPPGMASAGDEQSPSYPTLRTLGPGLLESTHRISQVFVRYTSPRSEAVERDSPWGQDDPVETLYVPWAKARTFLGEPTLSGLSHSPHM